MKATWWIQRSPGTTYWRCAVPARKLPGQALILNWRDVQPDPVFGDRVARFPRQKGAAIWQFPGNATRALMIAGMQASGVRCLVEVDDNYLIPPPPIPGMRYGDWVTRIGDGKMDDHSAEAHARIARFADGVICSTGVLADAYRHINKNRFVCRNSVDPSDWPDPDKPGDGILRVGYAGSSSHYHDIKLVRRALEWAAGQPGVEVLFYGRRHLVEDWRFPYTHVDWTDSLTQYRQSLQPLDVGLCPLRPGRWADCKSDLKAIEYAMAGVCPVVSDAAPFRPWHGRATVCTTEKDWLKAVQWAVRHPDEAKQAAAEAKAYVLAERTIDREIGAWEEACTPPR